ncbi:MAG: shikimate dehydrogenase [Oscillospiraceae bacterium]|nr:shikimate dehydrogenase [Oscillospiraceae bacterium]
MEFGLIGERLGHSCSPEIHRAFGRYDYSLKELSPAQLGAFLEKREFRGINVTIPYKEAVIPHLDRIDERAAAIGAVNTIVNRNGQLWGYNTDFGGMEAALGRAGIVLAGKRVLILGTGGTSKTALAVCRALGAREVLRVSRTGRVGAISYEEALATYGAPLIRLRAEGLGLVLINTTPAGMYPDLEGMAMEPEAFPELEGVFDCIYNPLRTRLVLGARRLGLPAEGGLSMLVKQAALACQLFTGEALAPEKTEQVYQELRAQRENLVLIGMPGAGKTTVGRLLAQKTRMNFVDTDEEIVKFAGMSIPEIFAARGEAGFRELETEVIRDLSRTGGSVIATGGGAILREENLRRLRQNGRLYFLDRPLEALLPTEDRPLGNTREKVAALYAARLPIYKNAADVTITCPATPEEAADAILQAPP